MEKKKIVPIIMDQTLRARLRKYREEQSVSIGVFVRETIKKELKRLGY